MFLRDTDEKSHTYKLKGLAMEKEYEISLEDGSSKALKLPGAQVMQFGVSITLPDVNSSELLFFKSK